MLRIREDRETVARYRGFESYPAGSLGRAYFDYMIANGFSFPGESGAPPEAMVFHDMTHILSGYATTPEGEICAATFSAGYSTREVYNWFMFVLSQFQLGLPTAPGVPPERMKLDPMRMLIAYRRGAGMTIDINEGWDFWAVIEEPVEALRERYHILPESHFAHLLEKRSL
jgi:ubiquinone biosynthesis protein Coq4